MASRVKTFNSLNKQTIFLPELISKICISKNKIIDKLYTYKLASF
jgi:hypothetical protein